MKTLLRVTTLALTLSVGACAELQQFTGAVTSTIGAVTSTIQNPVSSVNVYQVKNTYAATLQLVVDWRAYCWSKPYAALMADPIAKPVCQNRRAILRGVQTYHPKAAAAIRVADDFVRNNPTLDATSAISAAFTAVQNFKALVPVTPIQ